MTKTKSIELTKSNILSHFITLAKASQFNLTSLQFKLLHTRALLNFFELFLIKKCRSSKVLILKYSTSVH